MHAIALMFPLEPPPRLSLASLAFRWFHFVQEQHAEQLRRIAWFTSQPTVATRLDLGYRDGLLPRPASPAPTIHPDWQPPPHSGLFRQLQAAELREPLRIESRDILVPDGPRTLPMPADAPPLVALVGHPFIAENASELDPKRQFRMNRFSLWPHGEID